MTDSVSDQNSKNASGERVGVYCPKCESRVKNAHKHIPACQGGKDD